MIEIGENIARLAQFIIFLIFTLWVCSLIKEEEKKNK